MKTTLVVMAAGMGSRFGGLKQATAITEDGRGILDFSCYDAHKAGFDDVVFILRKDIVDEFKERIGNRISSQMPVTYVIQDTSVLPAGRTKPFGTGHAILCCKDAVKNPFCIINADDYYGVHAFKEIHDHLASAKQGEFCMVAYSLEKTLSDNGTVNRGICQIENGYMIDTIEAFDIDNKGVGTFKGEKTQFAMDTPVSMNLWGLTPDVFTYLQEKYDEFIKTADLMKGEFFVQEGINEGIRRGATLKVYHNLDRWYGMTYKEDLPDVKNAMASFIAEGLYPKNI